MSRKELYIIIRKVLGFYTLYPWEYYPESNPSYQHLQ